MIQADGPPFAVKCLASILLACGLAHALEPPVGMESPDGRLSAKFWVDGEGRPRYQLFRDGAAVIRPSPLGVKRVDGDFTRGLHLKAISSGKAVEDSYTLWSGKRSEVIYRAHQRVVILEGPDERLLSITLRLSDDGLAYRYALDHRMEYGQSPVLESETSGVHFHPETRAWLQPKAVARTGWSSVNPSYEEDYLQDIPVGTPSPSPNGWVFPALFRYGDHWIVVSESGMDGQWPGSNLAADSADALYRFRFPDPAEVIARGGRLPVSDHSPWRLVVVGDLQTIMESTLGTDLAEPSKLENTQWVKPGIAAWSWGVLKDESVVYPVQKEFVDYAAQLGWDYVLVDVNWDRTIGYERIGELADYAAGRGVGLLLWYNSSGNWNDTEYTPKGRMLTREARRAEFERLRELGIAGVKVDFFPGDGRSVMQRYLDIFEDAAAFELVVNVHGSTLPRGMQRTWPNFLTSEAVKGFEFVTFTQEFADTEATHAAMLPFTRNLFDPMDYTPTVLGDIPGIERRTRNGFQLALPVLFTSGIQHLVATPEQTAAMPDFVRDYLGGLPARWEDSRFIAGFPGRYAVIARRAGDTWYVAGISAGNEPRRIGLDLSFIGAASGRLIRDSAGSPVPEQVGIDTALDQITLAPGTGFVMVFGAGSQARGGQLE